MGKVLPRFPFAYQRLLQWRELKPTSAGLKGKGKCPLDISLSLKLCVPGFRAIFCSRSASGALLFEGEVPLRIQRQEAEAVVGRR